MKFTSVFDIIGPVMIGPSSSHTAGAARIGKTARDLFGKEPTWAQIRLYESFAKTYKGHGTDFALVGGLLGFQTDDKRLDQSLVIAEEKQIDIEFIEENGRAPHPNTARLTIGDETDSIEMVGISIGGGKIEIIEINGFDLKISGNHPAILVVHNDRFGAIASVTKILAKHEINIGHMEVNRKDVGKEALMVIEVDQNVEKDVLTELQEADHIIQVSTLIS
ncbi:MAG TPA: L-serine ammonia-lyase, iron-sulfur-dependent subunit beta [Bacillota bacterium]|nr:L-serine ammonia-lyase, iron-sulfur-dependent subunit beta [Bacillota bacterium]